jgi:hypothetical protein
MQKRLWVILLLILVLSDTTISFLQFLTAPSFDGDLAVCIVPRKEFQPVLDHPLGFPVIFENAVYANPNRFFSQFSIKTYFDHIPLLLQKFVSPIDSVYISCALIKIILQVLITLLISLGIIYGRKFSWFEFLLAYILVSVLFQTQGYRGNMAVIDPSPSYVFFYALPILFLIIYFIPIYKNLRNNTRRINVVQAICWIPLGMIICLSGPVNPGIILLVAAMVFIYRFLHYYQGNEIHNFLKRVWTSIFKIEIFYYYYLGLVVFLSLYSLFLGSKNMANEHRSIAEMYLKLAEGLKIQFTGSFGYPLLTISILINVVLVKMFFNRNNESQEILRTGKWILLFSLLYILLLPMGGYRTYRPNIIRYDIMIPITILLMYYFGLTSLYLIRQSAGSRRIVTASYLMIVACVFSIADKPKLNDNFYERQSLEKLAQAIESPVILDSGYVLQWDKFKTSEESDICAQQLFNWRITAKKILYYNK